MKVVIHKIIKRPWGPETPYTVIDDDGAIYNGSLLKTEVTVDQVIEKITSDKQKRLEADKISLTDLEMKKAELQSEVSEIDKQITEADESKQLI